MKKYHYVISLVSDGGMRLYKGEVQAAQKPDDMFRGDKDLSFNIEYFANKKDRDRYFDCNNTLPPVPKKIFGRNAQYCVISLVCDSKMTLFKGEVPAAQKPDDMYRGDKDFSFDVTYFESKKERNLFFKYNT